MSLCSTDALTIDYPILAGKVPLLHVGSWEHESSGGSGFASAHRTQPDIKNLLFPSNRCVPRAHAVKVTPDSCQTPLAEGELMCLATCAHRTVNRTGSATVYERGGQA